MRCTSCLHVIRTRRVHSTHITTSDNTVKLAGNCFLANLELIPSFIDTFDFKMKKRMSIAYLLWLFFGWFGLHHFYLKRDRQAFVWFCSLGGFLGCGWFRDLWRIPSYVRDANEEEEFLKTLTRRMRSGPPSFSIVR